MAETKKVQKLDIHSLENGIDHWELLDLIGEGTYGEVYKGQSKEDDKKLAAIKVIDYVVSKSEEIQAELTVFRKHSKHHNIVDFYGAYMFENSKEFKIQLWMAMELCEGGSVSDLVKKLVNQGSRLDENLIAHILSETLKGVQHLHKQNVIHRDIKGPNILLTFEGNVKLIDFGVSAVLSHKLMRRHSSVGTPFWMAPEVIACEQQLEYNYDNRCDIWSLGITAIEMADGEPPLSDQHPMRALFKIPRNPPPTVKRPDKWSPEYLDFIAKCLVKDFEKRSSVDDVLNHSFVAKKRNKAHLLRRQLITLLQLNPGPEGRKEKEDDVRAELRRTGERLDVRRDYVMLKVDDLAKLESLSDEIILGHLLERYTANQIYTYIGDILIAVNPFKELNIYSERKSQKYRDVQRSELPPHIYMTACTAYQALIHRQKDQCCVISGESGAGKTVSSNHLVNHLADLGRAGNKSLVQKILQVNPLMEAFGNAQTIINSNSSRFGKYLELHFTPSGSLVGAQLSEYLLEKSRVASQPRGERNFHMLYYLIAGLDFHRRLGHFDLSTSDRHRYLNTDSLTLDEVACTPEMQEKFTVVQQCFDVIGFTQEEVQSLYCILAAVIHIGDIEIIPDDAVLHQGENSKVLDMDTLKTGETITRNNTVEQAMDCRDATAKALYGRLFSWIVKRINVLLKADDKDSSKHHKIGILDIFGFENFTQNSFEQLCINIANEQLQFYFNQHVFEWEFEEYTSEGIPVDLIQFQNNRPIIDLFLQRPMGMLALLDEESRFPRATDITLVEKFVDNLQPNYFKKPKDSYTNFTISHYAGKVSYDATDFLSKNRDTLSGDILQVLRVSDDKLVRTLFQGVIDSQGRLVSLPNMSSGNENKMRKMSSASAQSYLTNIEENAAEGKSSYSYMSTSRFQLSMSTHFRNSLRSLMSKMIHADPHFVRCIRPNTKNVPDVFDQEKVLIQLRYTGVLETTRIRRQGYSERIPFPDFVDRYKVLVYSADEDVRRDASTCRYILKTLGMDTLWRIGRTKVFLKYFQVENLSKKLENHRRIVLIMQRCVRAWLYGIREKKRKFLRVNSAIVIQKHVRGWLDRKYVNYLRAEKQRKAIRERSALRIQTGSPQSQSPGVSRSSSFRSFMARKELRERSSKRRAQEEDSVSLIQAAYRGYRVRKWYKEYKRQRIINAATKLQAVARGHRDRKSVKDVEGQADLEDTQMFFFLAQIEMSTNDTYPKVQRTAYPVLYSLRRRSTEISRKTTRLGKMDPLGSILAAVDGTDDILDSKYRWARNQFEDDPDGKDTIKRDRANTHKSEANENENSDKSKRDRTSPYRIEINESSTSNLSSPRSPKSTGTTADSLSEESSVNGDPLTFEYPRQRAEYPLGKESTGYPSRSSYELRGTDSRDSRDEELRVSDFDWFKHPKRTEPRVPILTSAIPDNVYSRPPEHVQGPEPLVYPQKEPNIAPHKPFSYKPYNYLIGTESSLIAPKKKPDYPDMKPDYPDLKPDYALYENDHKPFRPYSYTDNNFNSVTANPKNQRVLPANPVIPAYLKHQHEPHVSLNRYPEHTNSIPHIPPNSINGYKESSPQMNGHVSGQKRPDPTETVPKGFYDRRKPRTDIDVHHNDVSPKDNPGTQAPQIKRKPLTAHNINELARIIGQANTNHDPYQYRANKPKTKRPSSGQKRGDTEHHGSSKPKIKSQGFNYGIPRTKEGLIRDFQLRKTGRLEHLVQI